MYALSLSLALVACGPQAVSEDRHDTGADTGTHDTDPVVDTGIPVGLLGSCEITIPVTAGTLCVLRPSGLDPETRDASATSDVGFGYHVVGIPDDFDPDKGLWVYFSGTSGRAYDQDGGGVRGELFFGEILAQGHLLVAPAYDNAQSINDDCGLNPDLDDCAGRARLEVQTGSDTSPLRDTPYVDSIDHRMETLLTHIQTAQPALLPAEIDPAALDWNQVTVGGISQGGNQAYWLAHHRGVRFGCMLASLYDRGDSVNASFPPIADWFTASPGLTPPSRLGQLVVSQDPNAEVFLLGAELVGLRPDEESFEVSLPELPEDSVIAHAAALIDPDLADERAQACFR